MRNVLKSMSAFAVMTFPIGAMGETSSSLGNGGFNISARVPTTCQISFQSDVSQQGNEFHLGQIRQFCNSPNGFTVSVDYTPGTLHNVLLKVGANTVVLDGSGHANLYHENGPKIAEYDVSAKPESTGFDSDSVHFDINPD